MVEEEQGLGKVAVVEAYLPGPLEVCPARPASRRRRCRPSTRSSSSRPSRTRTWCWGACTGEEVGIEEEMGTNTITILPPPPPRTTITTNTTSRSSCRLGRVGVGVQAAVLVVLVVVAAGNSSPICSEVHTTAKRKRPLPCRSRCYCNIKRDLIGDGGSEMGGELKEVEGGEEKKREGRGEKVSKQTKVRWREEGGKC